MPETGDVDRQIEQLMESFFAIENSHSFSDWLDIRREATSTVSLLVALKIRYRDRLYHLKRESRKPPNYSTMIDAVGGYLLVEQATRSVKISLLSLTTPMDSA
ncbi:Uncharacterized protein Rs2_39722 [Raphanus sativus]|nr:Uncharacterized protein Rs2_39722 [Raphanus sativus]